MTLLLVYLGIALIVSFVCSILEAVLLSITPSYVAALEQAKPAVGQRLAATKEQIDRPLAAILGLNTIAHTVGAAGVGAQALEVFGSGSVAAVSALLTLAMLVVSEIIPKTLGARYWKRLAVPTERVVSFLVIALYPLIFISKGISRVLAGPAEEPTVSRAELHALADVAHREGVVDEVESRFFRSLLRFRQLRGADIMTPRSVIEAFDESWSVSKATEFEDSLRFSRIPIYADTPESFTGYVLRHDLLLKAARGEGDTLVSELRRPLQA